MPPLLKKKSEGGGSGSAMAPWHPNLRNAARLPDTKVVRTSFFVNGVAMFLAIALLLWFIFQEYKLHNLNHQIADWQAQIDRDKKESDQDISVYKKFVAERAKVAEANTFVQSRPLVSDLLIYVSSKQPDNVALDSFELGPTGLTLRDTVRGTPDEATGYATAYLDQLRADKVLATAFSEISYAGSGVSRNPQSGRLSLQLFFRFGPDPRLKLGGKK
jgi:hypothetical protein